LATGARWPLIPVTGGIKSLQKAAKGMGLRGILNYRKENTGKVWQKCTICIRYPFSRRKKSGDLIEQAMKYTKKHRLEITIYDNYKR
jgi:hypothetical protein